MKRARKEMVLLALKVKKVTNEEKDQWIVFMAGVMADNSNSGMSMLAIMYHFDFMSRRQQSAYG